MKAFDFLLAKQTDLYKQNKSIIIIVSFGIEYTVNKLSVDHG